MHKNSGRNGCCRVGMKTNSLMVNINTTINRFKYYGEISAEPMEEARKCRKNKRIK